MICNKINKLFLILLLNVAFSVHQSINARDSYTSLKIKNNPLLQGSAVVLVATVSTFIFLNEYNRIVAKKRRIKRLKYVLSAGVITGIFFLGYKIIKSYEKLHIKYEPFLKYHKSMANTYCEKLKKTNKDELSDPLLKDEIIKIIQLIENQNKMFERRKELSDNVWYVKDYDNWYDLKLKAFNLVNEVKSMETVSTESEKISWGSGISNFKCDAVMPNTKLAEID